jgi:hypothetical protein
MPMKLKLDAEGHVVVQDGNPVYVHDDGKEVPFDANATVATIDRITGESKGYKTRAQAAETKLAEFDGIDDPKAAIAALKTVANLDDKKLVDAGEVEKVKQAAIASVEEKYKPIVAENDKLKGELHGEKIGGAFARSKFIADKVAVPADIVEARFGKNFKLEDGKVVAYGHDGNKIYSRAKPGEGADFEEALELLVDGYAHKDQILKGTQHSGTNKDPGKNPPNNGADLSKLSPVERMNAARAAGATR